VISLPTRRLVAPLMAFALALAAAGCTGTAAGSPPASGAGAADCPTSQPDPLPAGQTRHVTLDTAKGAIAIEVKSDLSPIAVGNFVALASCGFYDGSPFHRLVPGFVIQGGGDPTGGSGPGYTIQDEPVTATYHRGVVAMARSDQPNSVDSQFFIVLDDGASDVLSYYNTYQIIGEVTSGMDVVDAIAAMPNSGPPDNAAVDPVVITTATVTNP
jgi:cyclophilin family peptidyl-prolyl cis-trans isomerase